MILMTGASGGLGDYLVRQLAKEHAVVGTYNTHKPAVLRENVEYHQVDVSDSASVGRFAEAIEDKLDHVVLVNLAGVSLDGMGHKMDEAIWDRVVDTNLKGTFLMSRAILPYMRKQEWGRIINVSSIVGQRGIPGTAAYSASKGGLYSLTRTLAAENATKNITVNALALGYFEVGMINVLKPEVQEQIRATIPMRRFGHPRNVDLAIRFLIEADYVTGAVLNINGGLL
jgi:NAD(P)-dependent dehydrogenase (short-subunit alcohol dehydrogenase family)